MRAFLEKRDIAQRLVISGTLELTSPAHLGCGKEDEQSDQPLVTDQDGVPYLPGTTLAGLMRQQLPPDEAKGLFGPESQSDDDGEQSRLLFSDSHAVLPPVTELRDGVAIESTTGVAGDKTRYDFEVLSVGTKFAVRLELLLPGGDERSFRLKALTGRLLSRLETGRVRLGARSQRGFGDCRIVPDDRGVNWQIECYDFTSLDGLMAWIGVDSPERVSLVSGREWAEGRGDDPPPDFQVSLRLRVRGGVLIGSGGHGAEEADKSHLHRRTSDGSLEPVLAGTSLAGVLRHRCQKIVNTLGATGVCLDRLFGARERLSRIRVWEAPIRGGRTLRHSRVRIDPWTGGAAETALYTQDVHYGGEVEVKLSIREPDPAERALVLLALRDLAEGEVRVGGQTGAGRGRLAPVADGEFGTARAAGKEARLICESGRVRLEPAGSFADDFEALGGSR